MTNAELIAKIKAEIERRITDNTFGAKLELIDILAWLDTLESEKPINPDDAMKELDEKIALVKQRGTWDGVDVDKYIDEVRGREPEKPKNQEKFSKEFDEYFLPKNREQKGMWGFAKIYDLAEHFAEWGYLRAAEKYNEIEYNRQRAEEDTPNDLEEAAREFAKDAYPDKHNLVWMFKRGAKWQKEQMMKEAVEGLICATITGTNAISFLSPLPKELTAGDKVKLIICKED